jgi:transcriptional regulator with XRE-family HTH domain
MTDMARWDTNEYQRIVGAEPRKSDLKVVFEDGTTALVNYKAMLPHSSTQAAWEKTQVGPYEITVPTAKGDVEIPWSTIRVLTDPEFSAHLAAAAQDEAQHVGQRIRLLRKRRGLSGKELAGRAGITPQSLSRIENGRHDVVYTTLRRILAAMNCTLSELSGDPVDPMAGAARPSNAHAVDDSVPTVDNSDLRASSRRR